MDKNSRKEDAVQLTVKFGLKKDEAEEAFEEISKTIKHNEYEQRRDSI